MEEQQALSAKIQKNPPCRSRPSMDSLSLRTSLSCSRASFCVFNFSFCSIQSLCVRILLPDVIPFCFGFVDLILVFSEHAEAVCMEARQSRCLNFLFSLLFSSLCGLFVFIRDYVFFRTGQYSKKNFVARYQSGGLIVLHSCCCPFTQYYIYSFILFTYPYVVYSFSSETMSSSERDSTSKKNFVARYQSGGLIVLHSCCCLFTQYYNYSFILFTYPKSQ